MVKDNRGQAGTGFRPVIGLVTLVVLSLITVSVEAEIFTLVDGTQILGELVHYYNQNFEIKTEAGLLTLPREKVITISFEKRQVSKEFATPEETFKTWLKAIKANDLDKMTQCYGLVYQNIFAMQMKEVSAQERQEIFEIFLSDSLKIIGTETKDNATMLQLEFEENGKTETVWLKFLNEAGEWKMYPP
ncbi:hypothetical protein JXQ70_12395 [bacterium]|nr:hypothetical protein [bacterium]